jgi:hypothetical protein
MQVEQEFVKYDFMDRAMCKMWAGSSFAYLETLYGKPEIRVMKKRAKATLSGNAMTENINQRIERAQIALDAGDFKQAFMLLDDLDLAVSDAPQVAYLMSMIAMHQCQWRTALDLLEELAQTVERAVIHLDRATCLIELDRLDAAQTILTAHEDELGYRFPRYVLLARIAARREMPGVAMGYLKVACAMDENALAFALESEELLQVVAATVASRHQIKYNTLN